MSDTTSKDDELKPSNSEELRRYFEANFLDGETLQKGQLVSAVDVFEFIKQYGIQERIDELQQEYDGFERGLATASYEFKYTVQPIMKSIRNRITALKDKQEVAN